MNTLVSRSAFLPVGTKAGVLCISSLLLLGTLLSGHSAAAPPTQPWYAHPAQTKKQSTTLVGNKIPLSARKIMIVIETGSCWGDGKERKTIHVNSDHVLIGRSGKGKPLRKSLKWWKKRLSQLNEGIERSTSMPDPKDGGSCNAGNWFCGFWITATVGNKVIKRSGCCSQKGKGERVRKTFESLRVPKKK